ncbi:hypothetical protein RJ639_043700 [Escallonia herrerae]|uniref:Uncharacterized protein n=1 Tax=Escallonia herrerae TaxID=1293975 RepID=A0AA89B3N1_9ASTE|nr:hypothetical protein RJ639_043700 [Escallonia herrerae]
MLSPGGGGRFYWVRKDETATGKAIGIVAIFSWVSVQDSQLNDLVNLYSSLGWNSLVCVADFLNPIFPEKATSLAFSILKSLVEELKSRPCPLVFAALSGGSKACMYKIFQIIKGASEAPLNLDDSRLIMKCISGQIYDSSPVDFTGDFGAQFALHPTVLKMPGLARLISFAARGVISGLDALFVTRFSSERSDYWKTLYSSVSLGAPILILCSVNDENAPHQIICNFAQRLQDAGGKVILVKWNDSPHAAEPIFYGSISISMGLNSEESLLKFMYWRDIDIGHYQHCPIQYRASVVELLEMAVSVFYQKIQNLGERTGMEGMHDEISDLICDLQDAADNSNLSFRRVAVGPNDHFFLPSSAEYQNGRDSSLQEEQRERSHNLPSPPSISAHTVLGRILFDACVPKNIEGWDIKFSGSLNGRPIASACKKLPLNSFKCTRRSRL